MNIGISRGIAWACVHIATMHQSCCMDVSNTALDSMCYVNPGLVAVTTC